MRRYFLVFLFCILYTVVFGQGSNGLKDQIESYLNLLHSHPDQVPLVENRLSYEIKDSLGLEILRFQVLKRLEESPDDLAFAEILSWDYIQKKDFVRAFIQETALDKRGKEEGSRLFNLGKIALKNRDYATALKAFNYVISLIPKSPYYQIANRERLNVHESQILESSNQNKDILILYENYKKYLEEFKQGEDAATVRLKEAKLDIEYLGKLEEAVQIIQSLIQLPDLNSQFKARCKMELGKAHILQGRIWEAALLFSQVHNDFKEEPLGQEALFQAARLYYFSGDFALAKSQLDVLKTATSDLTSNDAIDLSLLIQKNLEDDSTGKALKEFSQSELLVYQHKFREAEKILDSLPKRHPHNALGDDILMERFKIHFSEHSYNPAALNLQEILDHFPNGIWADDALFHLAELNEFQFNQASKARSLYEKLFLIYPGSFYAGESRKRFRNLRGNTIN